MILQRIFFGWLFLAFFATPVWACRPFGSYQFIEDLTGGIWFTEGDNNSISRLAPDGAVTAHLLPTPQSEPSSLAVSPSGAIWFVAMDVAKIGRIEPDGHIVEYQTLDGHPGLIAVDSSDEAWFTQMAGNESGASQGGHGARRVAKVGRIDRNGQMHDYPVPQGWPTSIALDGHDQVWVTILVPGSKTGKPRGILANLSRQGEWNIVESWGNSCPMNLARTPGGGLAFSDHCQGILGRVDAESKISIQKLPPDTYIQQLTSATDGTLWFTGDEKGRLGSIDLQGRVSYVERPPNGDQTMAVLAASNGDVVFSEFYNYNINRLKVSGEFVEHLINVDDRKQVRKVTEGEVCLIKFAARIASKSVMDRRRAEEVRKGSFQQDGKGTERLVRQKCLVCHDARRLLLSRRSDWTPSINRMRNYREVRDVVQLTDNERRRLISYFNKYYGIGH